jgi:hypothetical protein
MAAAIPKGAGRGKGQAKGKGRGAAVGVDALRSVVNSGLERGSFTKVRNPASCAAPADPLRTLVAD